ncbi:MAG TPA: PAS domain-containing protein, partial [Roseiflexaceae bacterium]|nr:PAS domain-containing protein [Roseiflexaceae bacterium]
QVFAFNLGALVLVVGLAGIAIWLGGQWLIVRPATRLAFVTSQLASGEFQARSQLTYNNGELGQLASAVDRMAAGLYIQTEALRRSEERYRIIAGLIADYAVAVRFNAEQQPVREWTSGDSLRLTGYTADELERLGGWIATVHPEDRTIALDIQQPHTHTNAIEHELRIVTRDGTLRWVHVYRQYEWAEQGTRLTHYYDAINDITERKHAEAYRLDNERQLQESQRLESLGLLAGGIAHDFNNLLMTISGNAQMIQMQVGDNHPAYAMLDQVVVAVRRAADLTTQMLAYAGKGRIVVEHINLRGLVSEMAELLTTSLPKHVHLAYNLADDPLVIEGDATQMRQIVMNLII